MNDGEGIWLFVAGALVVSVLVVLLLDGRGLVTAALAAIVVPTALVLGLLAAVRGLRP